MGFFNDVLGGLFGSNKSVDEARYANEGNLQEALSYLRGGRDGISPAFGRQGDLLRDFLSRALESYGSADSLTDRGFQRGIATMQQRGRGADDALRRGLQSTYATSANALAANRRGQEQLRAGRRGAIGATRTGEKQALRAVGAGENMAVRDIRDQGSMAMADVMQDAISSGRFNSSVADNFRRGVASDTGRALADTRDVFSGRRAGVRQNAAQQRAGIFSGTADRLAQMSDRQSGLYQQRGASINALQNQRSGLQERLGAGISGLQAQQGAARSGLAQGQADLFNRYGAALSQIPVNRLNANMGLDAALANALLSVQYQGQPSQGLLGPLVGIGTDLAGAGGLKNIFGNLWSGV